MVQDRLTKAVLRRLKELDLPSSLIDLDGFREKFFQQQWLMVVRDGDDVADVHLFQPQHGIGGFNFGCAKTRRLRRQR